MNSFEYLLLNFNISWVFGRLLPYISIQIAAILSIKFFLQKLRFRKAILKVGFALLLFFVPISAYFYLFPIYEGDLYDLSEIPRTKLVFPKNKKLIVFVLPDCPYCHDSKVIFEQLLKRNQNIQIEIWISGDQEDLFYNSIYSKRLKIIHNKDFENTIYLTKGVFPTYAISYNKKLVKCWNNASFGARALDEIELFFKVYK